MSTFSIRLGLAICCVGLLLQGYGQIAKAEQSSVFVEIRESEAADARVIERWKLYGSSYALVIGINSYSGDWPRLSNAIQDARRVADALEGRGFEVTLKTDLTSLELRQELTNFYAIKGADPDARLLVWFAGHGFSSNGEGYLVPSDAGSPGKPEFFAKALPMRDFGSLVRLAKAKHAMAIFDSCFAGTIFNVQRSRPPPAITQAIKKPVRQFLTSGDADQQVADDGTFRNLFIDAINGEELADASGDGYLTGVELSLYLENRLTNLTQGHQTPRSGKLRDRRFDQGDFVFVLPKKQTALRTTDPSSAARPPSGSTETALELTFWNAIKDSNDPNDYEDYLARFPKGTFSGLAERRLTSLKERQQAALPPVDRPAPAVEIDEMDTPYRVITRANIRAGPGTHFDRIDTLSSGVLITVTGKVKGENWYRIAFGRNREGFIFGRLIQDEDGYLTAQAKSAQQNKSALSARTERTNTQVAVGVYPRRTGGVFKAKVHADLKNIDPIWTTAYITRNHGYMVYDTLFAMDANFEVHPQMAESYEVGDGGLTYTITLRDGLKWHDGTPVTAEDCIASIARWSKRDGMGQRLAAVTSSMKAVDDKTFQIKLTEPWGLVLRSLGKMSSNVPFMMPKAMARTDAFTQVPKIIGSGPFMFVKEDWVPGSKAVYVKNEDYVPRGEPASGMAGGKVVNFDRIEWHYIPDHNRAMNALINGEIDYLEDPAADLLPALQAADGVVVGSIDPHGSQGWLRMNHLHHPFDKKEARQAIQLLVDQETYLRAIVGTHDLYKTCPAMFVCDTPFANDANSKRLMTRNVQRAKQMLKDAGYNGEKVILMHPTDLASLSAATRVTARFLREAGINLEVQAMDWATLTSRRAETKAPARGGWNIFHTSWISPDLIDPVANIGVSGGCKEKAWFGWPCSRRLEQLRQAFARETNRSKQKQLAVKIQDMAMDLATYIPIGQYKQPIAYRDNVRDIIRAPVPVFWNLWRE